jgi:hypothetical protein
MISQPPAVEADDMGDLVQAASRPGFARWREMVAAAGGCADPIHLVGQSTTVDTATGELLGRYDTADDPNHRLLVACRNRRASRCAPCAEMYRADTYHLIRAGLAGGKTVPGTVSGHPRVFATLTAPSFGPVHHRVVDSDGSVRRCHPGAGCNRRHREDDPCLGQAVDPGQYDYTGAVIWNALAGVLWHRTATLIVRHLARHLGLTEQQFRQHVRVSYGKVAEFQARGLVHFHVIIRLDGPAGPHQPPPEELTVEALVEAVKAAVAQVVVTSPDSPATGGCRQVCWGEQIDIQPITAVGGYEGELTDQKVAGYLAKYATKAAENTGTLDRPVACWRCKGSGIDPTEMGNCKACHGQGSRHDDVHHLVPNPHAQAMISSCWTLGALIELEQLRLRPWAHMLGFRGHYSTRSRRYSTTLTALRQARRDWRDRRLLVAIGFPEDTRICRHGASTREANPTEDEGTILVFGHWQYIGRGHSPGESIYARTIAHDLAEDRRLARQAVEDETWVGEAG